MESWEKYQERLRKEKAGWTCSCGAEGRRVGSWAAVEADHDMGLVELYQKSCKRCEYIPWRYKEEKEEDA